MLLGSMLAGMSFANAPVAAVHALAYPVGARFHVPHGLSNSLVLPGVLRFNAIAAEPLYAEIAEVLVPANNGSARERCAALIDYLSNLPVSLGLPTRLRDVGISHNHLPQLAEDAMKQQRLLINNPREVSLDDARAIYSEAL
jgi:alcohol dehydrogenase class IV